MVVEKKKDNIMIYAIYRCLYGETFVQESINSITDHVDKIFIFWDDKPWGDVIGCNYKGQWIQFPKKFDDILDKIKELKNSKIELIYDHVYDNRGQFTHLVNNHILPNYPKPDIIMIIEVDQIFRQDQFVASLKEFKWSGLVCADTRQIELWRYLNYRISERKDRIGVVFWNMRQVDKLPKTYRQGNIENMPRLSTQVHNLGFAISEKIMYWKHLTSLAFSQKIRDSMPNENWYEKKWLNWDFETNNSNLEIAQGCEYLIPYAIEYDTNQLPETIRLNNLDQRRFFWSIRALRAFGVNNDFFVKNKELFFDKNVLEIGPGFGNQYNKIKDIVKTYGIIDISKEVLDHDVFAGIKEKYEINTYNIDLNKKFDVIHFWFVIHHILKSEIVSFINFLARHVSHDGYLLFNYPSHKHGVEDNDGLKTSLFKEAFIEDMFNKKFVFKKKEKVDRHIYVVAKKNNG